jgi:hypothetical protein
MRLYAVRLNLRVGTLAQGSSLLPLDSSLFLPTDGVDGAALEAKLAQVAAGEERALTVQQLGG